MATVPIAASANGLVRFWIVTDDASGDMVGVGGANEHPTEAATVTVREVGTTRSRTIPLPPGQAGEVAFPRRLAQKVGADGLEWPIAASFSGPGA